MTRFTDVAWRTFSAGTAAVHSHIAVQCPDCGGIGKVTVDRRNAVAKMTCSSCNHVQTRNLQLMRVTAHGFCPG